MTRSLLSLCLVAMSASAFSKEDLSPELRPLEAIATTEAQLSTATAIYNICPQLGAIKEDLSTDRKALSSGCTSMVVSAAGKTDHPLYVEALSSPQALRQVLSDIAHEETTGQGTIYTETSQTQFSNIGTRLNNLRRGSARFFSGFEFNLEGQALPVVHLSEDAPGGLLASPVNFFINGSINAGEKTGTAREDGFDFTTNGLTLGGDYQFANTGFAGAALGVSTLKSDIDSVGSQDKMDSSSWTVSVYGTQFSKSGYITGMAAIGQNEITNTRTIAKFADKKTGEVSKESVSNNMRANRRDVVNSDTNARSIAISVSAGKEIALNAFTLAPYAKVDLNRIGIDAYDEAGSAFGLQVDEQTVKSFSSIVGFQVVHADALGFGVITEQLRLEWRHEYEDNSRDISANYVLDPFADKSTFNATTDAPDRDSFIVGAGLTTILPNGLQIFGYVETTFGLADMTNTMFTVGGRMEL